MRRLLILLSLALLAATWLVLRPGKSTAVAPTGEESIDEGTERAALVDVGDPERTRADPGALDTTLDAGDDPPDPIERMELGPGASLTVRALLPDGSPWKDGRIQIASKSSLSKLEFELGSRSGHSQRFRMHSTGPSGDSSFCELDEHGAVQMHAEQPLILDLCAVDVLGGIGATATDVALQLGESRTIELWADRFPIPLFGRCVNERGRPLPGATVDVHNAVEDPLAVSYFQRRTTNEVGEFDTPPLFVARVNVRAALEDRISAERLDVPVGSSVVELVLGRGRRLVVEMHDDSGAPFDDVAIYVHEQDGDGPLDVPWEPCDEGRLYTALPSRPLELRWGAPCAPEAKAVDAGVERVALHIRQAGALAIDVGTLPGDTDTRYAAGLYCSDGITPAWPPKSVLNTGHQQVLWTLAPGRYVLQLLHLPAHAPEAWIPWGTPIEVEVRSGETTLEHMGG